jgi:mevalonate kinase
MTWSIPAKTFLLGEYAALLGAPAIVMTTSPCFEVSLTKTKGLHGIHKESPAGLFWLKSPHADKGLHWHDPYQGCGGMGASSAQFIGAYRASKYLSNQAFDQDEMLNHYFEHAFSGQGIRPSGYDVIAQSMHGCVYIDKKNKLATSYEWPFNYLACLLIHTGKKLATHHHLQHLDLPKKLNTLSNLVEQGKQAFEYSDSAALIAAINAYHEELSDMQLVADHTLQAIAEFKQLPDILAVKGCGAMGSDIILLVVPASKQDNIAQTIASKGWNILATHKNIKKIA